MTTLPTDLQKVLASVVGMDLTPSETSALACLTSGTASLESHIRENPAFADVLFKIANRLMTVTQKMKPAGHHVPKSVRKRAAAGTGIWHPDTDA